MSKTLASPVRGRHAAHDLEEAIERGHTDIESLKRYTRLRHGLVPGQVVRGPSFAPGCSSSEAEARRGPSRHARRCIR